MYKSLGVSFVVYEQEGRDKDLPAYLAEVAVAGFSAVEMRLDKFFATKESTEAMAVAMRVNARRMHTALAEAALDDQATVSQTMINITACADRAKPRDLEFQGVCLVPLAGERARGEEDVKAAVDRLLVLASSLKRRGLWLAIHNDIRESMDGGRLLRALLDQTASSEIGLSLDVEWLCRGGGDPLALLKQYGPRLRTLHLRQSKDSVWTQELTDGEVDYRAIDKACRTLRNEIHLVVELNHMQATLQTRRPVDALKNSRQYVRRVFAV